MKTAETLPVFIFDGADFEKFNLGGVDEYDARYVVAPFPRFVLRPDRPAEITVFALRQIVHVREIDVTDEGNGKFRVVETLSENSARTELLVDVDEACVRWDAWSPLGRREPAPGTQTWHRISEAGLDAAGAARTVIGLLLALNHRDVIIVNAATPTRQQRRAAERSGEPLRVEHRVRVPGEIIRYARSVANGKMAKCRAAHHVRAHVRRLGDGRITKVRAHSRGTGQFEGALIYDATCVGGAA